MSARVEFMRDETVLAQVGKPISKALSVDTKEQSCKTGAALTAAKEERKRLYDLVKAGNATFLDEHALSLAEGEIESSRLRLNRRARRAMAVLMGKSPMGAGHRDTERGKCFYTTMCGIVPLEATMALELRASGRIDSHGVFRCGSIWACPTCAQNIAVTRSRLCAAIIGAAREAGHRVVMITRTFPHDRYTPLAVSIARARDAGDRFICHGSVRAILEQKGYVGRLSSMEITLALKEDPNDPATRHNNGWHVHFHDLYILAIQDGETTHEEDQAAALQDKIDLSGYWKSSCLAAGIVIAPKIEQAFFDRGFSVDPVWSDTDYPFKLPEQVEKARAAAPERRVRKVCEVTGDTYFDTIKDVKPRWGAENELTKSYIKERAEEAKSRTPFQLLDDRDPADAALFLEYASATFGRSQVEWSRGKRDLRRVFAAAIPAHLGDASDEVLAASPPPYEFTDETKLPQGIDIVVEHADIARDDCWRARKLGRNAMGRLCALIETGRAFDLVSAARAVGFDVDVIEEAGTEAVPIYNEEGAQVRVPVFEQFGRREDDWEIRFELKEATVYKPRRIVLNWPKPRAD